MLSKHEVHAMLPVQDLKRAKKFYAEKLGLTPKTEMPQGLLYQSKDAWFVLFTSSGASTAQFTQAGWTTNNLEAEVAELKAKGVVFEEYNLPNLKTVNSIATTGGNRAAWFKDSEGNLLGLVQDSELNRILQ
jgi:catechol 2,3-dioxygenase-like lactoylglutathione lyase family enzyme